MSLFHLTSLSSLLQSIIFQKHKMKASKATFKDKWRYLYCMFLKNWVTGKKEWTLTPDGISGIQKQRWKNLLLATFSLYAIMWILWWQLIHFYCLHKFIVWIFHRILSSLPPFFPFLFPSLFPSSASCLFYISHSPFFLFLIVYLLILSFKYVACILSNFLCFLTNNAVILFYGVILYTYVTMQSDKIISEHISRRKINVIAYIQLQIIR